MLRRSIYHAMTWGQACPVHSFCSTKRQPLCTLNDGQLSYQSIHLIAMLPYSCLLSNVHDHLVSSSGGAGGGGVRPASFLRCGTLPRTPAGHKRLLVPEPVHTTHAWFWSRRDGVAWHPRVHAWSAVALGFLLSAWWCAASPAALQQTVVISKWRSALRPGQTVSHCP